MKMNLVKIPQISLSVPIKWVRIIHIWSVCFFLRVAFDIRHNSQLKYNLINNKLQPESYTLNYIYLRTSLNTYLIWWHYQPYVFNYQMKSIFFKNESYKCIEQFKSGNSLLGSMISVHCLNVSNTVFSKWIHNYMHYVLITKILFSRLQMHWTIDLIPVEV